MDMLETLLNARGGGTVRQMGAQLGLSETQTTTLGALVPALAVGLQRNLQTSGGIENLAAALGAGNHQRYLDDPATLRDTTTIADGDGILSHLFGGREVSRQVARPRRRADRNRRGRAQTDAAARGCVDDGLDGAAIASGASCHGDVRVWHRHRFHVDADAAARSEPRRLAHG
jgi:hypothetical protein